LEPASFKASIPQGEELISWLKEIGWGGEGGMATTFARHAVYSLRDITNLPQEQLRKICHAKVSKNHSQPGEMQVVGVKKYLKGAIDDLKKSERSKDLQYQLDIFRDMTISGNFAHHGMEVMVTKTVSLCALEVLGVPVLAYCEYLICFYLPVLVNQVVEGDFSIKQGKELEVVENNP